MTTFRESSNVSFSTESASELAPKCFASLLENNSNSETRGILASIHYVIGECNIRPRVNYRLTYSDSSKKRHPAQ